MKILKVILVTMFIGIITLTIYAANLQGINLFKHAVLTGWQAQFNFDFSCYLLLSAIWVAWRYRFSSKGIILALIAFPSGIIFFAPYLFFLTIQAKGSVKKLVLGKNL